MNTPDVSVVIATLNRQASLQRLLKQLGRQTLPFERFEVVIVDDGSTVPVAEELGAVTLPFRLVVLRSERSGAAAARHRGITHAAGNVVVILDDDVQIECDFLEQHLVFHPVGSRHAVLGSIRPDPTMKMPLFERFHADVLARFAADASSGDLELEGTHMATANVSFRRADYMRVGGFDPSLKHSEDAELGVRLQKSGVSLRFAQRAGVVHSSDHTSLAAWLRRAFLYGVCDLQIARKHPDVYEANPWRYLWIVHPVSRVLLATAVIAPTVMHLIAKLMIGLAIAIDRLGALRLAITAATVVYGIEYFRGVRDGSGSLRGALTGWREYVSERNTRFAAAVAGHGC